MPAGTYRRTIGEFLCDQQWKTEYAESITEVRASDKDIRQTTVLRLLITFTRMKLNWNTNDEFIALINDNPALAMRALKYTVIDAKRAVSYQQKHRRFGSLQIHDDDSPYEWVFDEESVEDQICDDKGKSKLLDVYVDSDRYVRRAIEIMSSIQIAKEKGQRKAGEQQLTALKYLRKQTHLPLDVSKL